MTKNYLKKIVDEFTDSSPLTTSQRRVQPESYDQPDYDNWLGLCNDCGARIRKCFGSDSNN